MPKTEPFEKYPMEYEAWFERHPKVYEAELSAVRKLLPLFENGIEIGVGSGRFALPFGIKKGVEPSAKMGEIAQSKGIEIINAVAEKLPFKRGLFDLALMVTTICFVERDSAIGKAYEKNRKRSRFYQEAHFFSNQEVISLLQEVGFNDIESSQTLFGDTLENVETFVKEGVGEGAFVVIRAKKKI